MNSLQKVTNDASSPLISVCCLTYNHEDFIKESIESIFNQNYKNIEIIVLNDGSTDKTLSLLEELSNLSKFPFIIIDQKNSGNIPANLNKLIRASSGNLIMMLSLDDKLVTNCVSSLFEEIIKDNSFNFVVPENIFVEDILSNQIRTDKNNVSKLRNSRNSAKDLLKLEKDSANSFYIQGCLFKKKLLVDCGLFDEDMLGDDIVIRVKIFKYMGLNPDIKFKIIDGPTCFYRIHQNNIHKNSERQCEIIYQVNSRYFNKKTSKILEEWIRGAILSNLMNGEILGAIRLLFFDKKNKSKLKTLAKVCPIYSMHMISLLNRHLKYKVYNRLRIQILKTRRFFGYRYKMVKFINFKTNGDHRGSLISLEANRNIPFKIKRVYYIFNTSIEIERGFHAHFFLRQVLICVSGSCRIRLDNGNERTEVFLDSPDQGLYIKEMMWREMYDFSSNCVLMVLASDYYNEDDYIRDYSDFKKLTSPR